jgi:hypothetical protein
MGRLLLASIGLALLLPRIAAADEQAEARAILENAIKAHGGEAVLRKIVAGRTKVNGTSYDGIKRNPFSYESTTQGFDKMRIVSFDDNGKTESIEVVNGKEGWFKEGDHQTEAMSEAQLKSRLEDIYLDWISSFVPLRRAEFRLSPLKEMTVGERKAIGILVHHEKHDDIKLYFDRESHLFVKYERRFNNVDAGTVVNEHTIESDYRAVQGVKLPFKFETYWGGVMACEGTFKSVELFDKPLGKELFAKP